MHKAPAPLHPRCLRHVPSHHLPTPLLFPLQSDAVKYSRNNADMRPFEAGGESLLESHCARNNCSLFALGSHQKKRPHNLVLGRLFDFRLYDMVRGIAALLLLSCTCC